MGADREKVQNTDGKITQDSLGKTQVEDTAEPPGMDTIWWYVSVRFDYQCDWQEYGYDCF